MKIDITKDEQTQLTNGLSCTIAVTQRKYNSEKDAAIKEILSKQILSMQALQMKLNNQQI